jgi:hypothetical protein
MSVSISFPKFELPNRYPILHAEPPSWNDGSLRDLAGHLGVDARFEDRGLWHVARDSRSTVEVYAATHSFRQTAHSGASEWEHARETGLSEADAVARATEFITRFLPSATSQVASVFESEVLLSKAPGDRPTRFVTGTQVNFIFSADGIAFIGPGAKMQVTLRPDGEVASVYRMWREVKQVGEVPGYSVDELAVRFGRSAMFADLTDETARVEITSVAAGLLCIPPTERQAVLHPALSVRGTITTRAAEGIGFSTYIGATESRRLYSKGDPRARRVPQLITA